MTTQTPMPALYLPHGGGPAFFMQGPMGELFRPMAEFLASVDSLLPATPSAIVVVSAHWEAPVATVTAGAHPELIFDYFGFPPETYQLTYAAPGAPALAASVADLLLGSDIDVHVDPDYGWDHGVFIPLKVMYPEADIPVVAMSLRAGARPGTPHRHRRRPPALA
jgi:aromatic ring-opening dioxygenase catalytic subunit (LigB family)